MFIITMSDIGYRSLSLRNTCFIRYSFVYIIIRVDVRQVVRKENISIYLCSVLVSDSYFGLLIFYRFEDSLM